MKDRRGIVRYPPESEGFSPHIMHSVSVYDTLGECTQLHWVGVLH
jgi:hypothetical protein